MRKDKRNGEVTVAERGKAVLNDVLKNYADIQIQRDAPCEGVKKIAKHFAPKGRGLTRLLSKERPSSLIV